MWGAATWWGLGAGVPAVVLEYLYRVLPGPWAGYLWIWGPASLWISYAIYRLVTLPHTPLLGAFVVWATSTMLLRTFLSAVVLRDRITWGTWAAVGLMITARLVQGRG